MYNGVIIYSLDLRKKALIYIENGASLAETSRIFGVTTRTLSNWLQRQKLQDLAPKMHGSSPSKIDNDKLKKYIEDHPDSYLSKVDPKVKTKISSRYIIFCHHFKVK